VGREGKRIARQGWSHITPRIGVSELTVYELLGYLLPGAALLCWTLLVPWQALTQAAGVWIHSPLFWPCLTVLAYVAGHFVQAVANFLPTSSKHTTMADARLGRGTVACIESSLAEATEAKGIDETDAFDFCDAHVGRCGCFPERDLLTYREGFYRGMTTVSAVVLLQGWVAYLLGNRMVLNGVELGLGHSALVWALLVVFGLAFLRRYLRFRRYRIRGVLISFWECSVAGRADAGSKTQGNQAGQRRGETEAT